MTGRGEHELTIGQAAAITGVGLHALRYYETQDLLRVPRTATGHRRYRPEDIAAIRFITQLRRSGMPIRVIHTYAASVRAGTNTAEASLDLLEKHRDVVVENLAEQREYLRVINAKIDAYRRQLAS